MNRRLDLHEKLVEILGSRNVYFQPPESLKMKYPAIVYSVNGIDNRHANDTVYNSNISYRLVVIDKDPDSSIVGKIAELPLCRFNSHYTSDNLNHDVFTLFY